MNIRSLLPLLLLAALPAAAETLTLTGGCTYQGSVQAGRPHGQGTLVCNDGRAYQGGFVRGRFHGQGRYTAPDQAAVFLHPYGLRSGQVRGMTLAGRFQNGSAHGRHQVFKNQEHLFDMEFEHGQLKHITASPKARYSGLK